MHKNEFHAVLSPRNAEAGSLTVAAQRHPMTTAAQTAQRFRQLYAHSQSFSSMILTVLRATVVNQPFTVAFAERSLVPAELHSASATAAKAANFSRLPAEPLQ